MSKDKELTTEEKDLTYWKNNCEEDYLHTPISVLRYITELEDKIIPKESEVKECEHRHDVRGRCLDCGLIF